MFSLYRVCGGREPEHADPAGHDFRALPRMRFHDVRHGAASLMLAQGVPLSTISDILGHSGIRITADTYAHLTDELKRDAANAMTQPSERPRNRPVSAPWVHRWVHSEGQGRRTGPFLNLRGAVAKWQGRGLQNLHRGFDSRRRLQASTSTPVPPHAAGVPPAPPE